MTEAASNESAGVYQKTANDVFKQTFGAWLWGSVALATALHFGAFALFPEFTAADMSFAVKEFEAIELPPEVEVPPPPEQIQRPAIPTVAPTEMEEEVTIAPTTFEDNPVDKLPPPPSDASRLGDQPVFTPYTVKPELKNPREAVRIVEKAYPNLLKQAGIGGTVVVWVFINTNGQVQNADVNKSSGNKTLDEAAREAAMKFEFTPALNRDKKVPVWISIPITFSVT